MDASSQKASGRGRLKLAADGFLFSAAVDIAITAVLLGVVFAAFGDPASIGEGPLAVALQLISMPLMVLAVLGGAILTWRLHGRGMSILTAVWMLAGVIVGMVVAMPVFVGGAMLMSRLPFRSGDGPPWVAIGVLAALVAAFIAVPLFDAVRDLSTHKEHVRLDWMRIAALAVVILLAVVALPLIGAAQGSELGEAGIFMVPFAAAGAFAVTGADIIEKMIARRDSVPKSGVSAV